ncbi:hypothetical protein ACFLIM_21725 [Nonomuraea sp. M3C6]|uniref:Uncharacterized protein n=1 Tax=Nonomuraea marmarensis TaxID=3351344 RepID=A0ABW7AI15_9ACTN
MTVQDLRDVLRERAEAPSPANPYRHDQVRSRIRRTRLRRRATAGAAVAAAVVVGFSLLPGTAEPPRDITAAAQPAPSLPERFTSDDGTEYRRVATATLKANGERKTSVTVPVSGRPLDVAGLCNGTFGSDMPRISVNGNHTGGPGFTPCAKEMELRPLIVPTGATEVTVTFDTTAYGCVLEKKNGPCVPTRPRQADWSLAVYEWNPPARQIEPEPVRAFPARLGGMKLATFTSGMWGKDSAFTLQVTSPGGKVAIDQLCTGDLAGRMWFRYQIDGADIPVTASCGVWKEGPFPMALHEFAVPKGKRATISGRMGLWGDYTNRPVRWSFGVYVK